MFAFLTSWIKFQPQILITNSFLICLSGFALEEGIHINADNIQELDVIAEELENMNGLVFYLVCHVFVILTDCFKTKYKSYFALLPAVTSD